MVLSGILKRSLKIRKPIAQVASEGKSSISWRRMSIFNEGRGLHLCIVNIDRTFKHKDNAKNQRPRPSHYHW